MLIREYELQNGEDCLGSGHGLLLKFYFMIYPVKSYKNHIKNYQDSQSRDLILWTS
jgi:hypothetical protein